MTSDQEPLLTYLWRTRPSAREFGELLVLAVIFTIASAAVLNFGIWATP